MIRFDFSNRLIIIITILCQIEGINFFYLRKENLCLDALGSDYLINSIASEM